MGDAVVRVKRHARWRWLHRVLVTALWPVAWVVLGVYTVLVAGMIALIVPFVGVERIWPALKSWARLLYWLTGAELTVRGLDRMPNGPAVIVSNHASHLDGPGLALALPRPIFFVVKKELTRIPVFGQGLLAIGSIKVDRGRSEKSRRQMAKAIKTIRHGRSVLVFAEGTRSPDGGVAEFKKGGFHLAIDAQVPVLPVSIRGSHDILPKGARRPRKLGRVEVVVGRSIPTEGLTKQDVVSLRDRAREVVLRGAR